MILTFTVRDSWQCCLVCWTQCSVVMSKRKTCQKSTIQLPNQSRKLQRRLPSNLKSIDIIQAMHDADIIDEEEQGKSDK